MNATHRGRRTARGGCGAVLACAVGAAVLFVSGSASAEVYLWPMHGPRRISSSFSEYRGGHYHAGIDLRSFGAIGLPCLAVGDGFVSRVKIEPYGYGKALYLRLADGRTAVYAHLDRLGTAIDSLAWHQRVLRGSNWCDIDLPEGAFPVSAGDTVAWSGQTATDAPHLHFEIRDEGQHPLNPLGEFYEVPDESPPIVSGLMILPLDTGSVTGSGPGPAVRQFRASGRSRYLLPDTIQLSGSFGFAVSVWDEQGFGRYLMAPLSIDLAIDGQTCYSIRNGSFSFDQAGEIGLEYEVAGPGAAGRYLVMYRRDGVTRRDRRGDGRIHRGTTADGVLLSTGLHVGLVTATDAAGNSCRAIFHFAIHDFPVVTQARRLEAADEVVVSVVDPDGGPVSAALFESLDGGGSWRPVPLEQIGSYLHGAVSPDRGALWRLEATDDEGARVTRWFGAPAPVAERDMAFCQIRPSSSPLGTSLEIIADRPLAAPPLVTAVCGARVDTLRVRQLGPTEFSALAPGSGSLDRPVVFSVRGLDHRGYPVRAHAAVRILPLRAGVRGEAVIDDTTTVELEPVSPLRPFEVIVGEAPPRAVETDGLHPLSSPFTIDFPVDATARPIRLHCGAGERTGLFQLLEDGRWSCVGVPARQGGSVSIGEPGTYALLEDRLPPRMRHVTLERTPSGGSFYRDLYCSVPVTDEG
ncbi:MAG: M23 family metallopeptidase, partial [Candidatus Krumholzibacteria bacterium]|nr:M23 family metallopeptidase [Candidatus Krumholzibacteria bacterium]